MTAETGYSELGTWHILLSILSGIHSTKFVLFFCLIEAKDSSTAEVSSFPLKIAAAVRIFPLESSLRQIAFLDENNSLVNSLAPRVSYCLEEFAIIGAREVVKKCSLGNGHRLVHNLRTPALLNPPNLTEAVLSRMTLFTNRLMKEKVTFVSFKEFLAIL